MPWKEATKMTERDELVRKWKSGLYTITGLAEQFGVSRPTVYLWIGRFESEGDDGLVDRPPIAQTCPHRTASAIADRIVEEKERHRDWGPEKLIDLLRKAAPREAWPAASTAGRILDARGMVKKRQRRRTPRINHVGRLNPSESGEMMTVDHKGEFRLGNGGNCHPLTINEPVSRYIYAVDGLSSTSAEQAKPTFVRVFKEHGVPQFIGSDNGGPFSCSHALGGLSQLAVWWIRLGVTPVRIHKGCPWENGIHERMHRTLKAATARPAAADMKQQQVRFDRFRDEFNTVRPHKSLGGQTPGTLLKPCKLSYPSRLPAIEYPAHFETRSVRSKGQIRWQGDLLFVSETLAGERVGLEEVDDGIWTIQFAHIELGLYDERTKSIS